MQFVIKAVIVTSSQSKKFNRIGVMKNTREAAKFLGVNKDAFSFCVAPLLKRFRQKGLDSRCVYYREEDLQKIHPILKTHGCGKNAAKLIKKLLERNV